MRQAKGLGWLIANSYAILVSAYCGIVLISYLYFGVLFQSPIGIISLALIPVVFLIGRTKRYLRDWVSFLILMLSYESLEGIAPSLSSSRGIHSVYPIDRMLWGINLTGQFQSFFYSDLVTDISTILYSLQFVLVVVLAITLWHTTRFHFKRYAYALVITSYSCLAVFVLIPTSPPWYLGAAVDLLQKPSSIPSILTPAISAIDNATNAFVSDKFAAFPSMHAAYAILFGYYMARARLAFAFFAIPITTGILFSTLYLGQHFLLELLGGALVTSVAIWSCNRLVKNDSNSILERKVVTTN